MASCTRRLQGTLLLALGAAPVGVFLMLRRMSLAGDAMAHAVLPGAAVAYLLFGLALVPMTIGGLIAGLAVALGAGAVSRSDRAERRRLDGGVLSDFAGGGRVDRLAAWIER